MAQKHKDENKKMDKPNLSPDIQKRAAAAREKVANTKPKKQSMGAVPKEPP